MDQKTPNGSDKRSWRERLGVGTGKELPRISEEFKSVNVKPGEAPRAAVRPAPMAPRTPPKPGSVAPEKLADKLKAQRDASEKLAEQRINAARQRAEIKPTEAAPNGSAKPKFGFADVEQPKAIPVVPPIMSSSAPGAASRPLTPPPARTVVTPPSRPLVPPPAKPLTPALQGRPSTASGIAPPRQPLGTNQPIMPPRPAMPQSAPPLSQSRFAPSYSQPPLQGYRPIDQGQRYTPPYTPPPLPTRGSFGSTGSGYGSQPRLNLPPIPAQGGNSYGADDYAARQAPQRGLRAPQRPGAYRQDYQDGELFEDQRQQRRASAGEYAQAYRDLEQGYEEDIPRSRGPWMLLLLLLLAGAVAAGLVWFYYNNVKNQTAGTGGNTPVVQAPGQAVKTAPAAKQPDSAAQPSKKQIYDRIVGDREVLGGDVMQSEEQPISPGDAIEPVDSSQDPAVQGGGEELTPLPLPPPPGGDDQQGSLPQSDKQDSVSIVPAAGESQAAVVPSADTTTKSSAEGFAITSVEAVPVPGDGVVPGATNGEATATTKPALQAPDLAVASAPAMKTTDTAEASGSEVIADPAPVVDVKPVGEIKPVKPKKVAAKAKEKSLGAAPVVLVAPGESTANGASPDDGVLSAEGGGLYAGEGVVDPAQQQQPTSTQPAPKKRRTLADLFRSNDDAAAEPAAAFDNSAEPAPTQKKLPAAPQPEQQQAALGGYIVQLASFQSREQASAEFNKLSAKHASLGGLSPIIREATVGGSTRYRLAAGVLASREQASAVCSKLFAAGQRDCQVRQQ